MKSLIRILALFLIVNAAMFQAPAKAQVSVGVNFQIFFDQLSPYGQWVNYPGYGYGWIPAVGTDFSPYATAGHWVFTDYGWTWVSDYTWGWAAFHYGRWNYDPYYGWIWVPDNVWGPAWVSWREAPGYYGWAPMGWGRDYDNDYGRWTFCGDRYFDQPDQDHYYINQSNNTTIINNSTVINNIYRDPSSNTSYRTGPDVNQVQRRTGRTIDAVPVLASNTPGEKMSRGQLSIYKPRISQNSASGQSAAPAHVVNLQDVKSRGNNNVAYARADVNQSRANSKMSQTRQQNNSNTAVTNVQQQPRVQQTVSSQEKRGVSTPQNSPVREQPSKQLQRNPTVKTDAQQKVNTTANTTRQPSPSYGRDQHQPQVNIRGGDNVKQQPARSDNNTPQTNRQPVNTSRANNVRQQPAQVQHNPAQVNQQQPPRGNATVNNSRTQQYTQPRSNEGKVNRDVSGQQRTQVQQPNQNNGRRQ